ncbi:MAG: Glu-tRNA(Gln) amidotransferase GatDE subunit D, partial [Thermoplasmatota archaeon]
FRSIDSRPLAFVDDTVRFIGSYRRKTAGETRVTADIDDNVALVYAHPGLRREDFAAMTERRDGVVVAGTGLGHINEKLIPVIRELTGNGVPVVMTTQCIWGRVNMHVYSAGRRLLLQAGVIPGGDMLPETALVKLMWTLANVSPGEVATTMQRNLAGEITERTLYDTFPRQKTYMEDDINGQRP